MALALSPLTQHVQASDVERFPVASGLNLPFSKAVRVGNLLLMSGELGVDYSDGADYRSHKVVQGGIEKETEQLMQNIKATLERCKIPLEQVIRCEVMLADMSDFRVFNAVYTRHFADAKHLPARCTSGVKALALGAKVEVMCTAVQASQDIDVEHFPVASGLNLPFSKAVRVGNLLFMSGELGVDHSDGADYRSHKVVQGGIQKETQQMMENIKATLKRCGTTLDRVIMCDVMLADMKEVSGFKDVYTRYFDKVKTLPAGCVSGVNGLALGARVEAMCIAIVQDTDVQYFPSDSGLDLPFSKAVRVGKKLFMSGEFGFDYESKQLVKGGIQAETQQLMKNIKATLESCGTTLDRVIRCEATLKNMEEWSAFNSDYTKTFDKEQLPARCASGVEELPLGARVVVKCTASI